MYVLTDNLMSDVEVRASLIARGLIAPTGTSLPPRADVVNTQLVDDGRRYPLFRLTPEQLAARGFWHAAYRITGAYGRIIN